MRLRYRLLNVFAREGDPFSGNPLCVFEDAAGLDDAQMQGLARQFNLSETAFIVGGRDGRDGGGAADGADAAVRIFATTFEMPFAGHPTLGTAHVLRDLLDAGGRLRLSMPAGVIPVEATGDTWTLTARPGVVERDLDAGEIAAAVGLEASDLVGPVQQVSTGSPQIIAQTASVEAVRRAVADGSVLRRYGGMGVRGGDTLVYLWTQTGAGTALARALISEGTSAVEDPATGSACANLGAWLVAQGRTGVAWEISQGEQTGRPSTLRLRVGDDGVVRVGGLVREMGSGEVEL